MRSGVPRVAATPPAPWCWEASASASSVPGRSVESGELQLASYEWATDRDPLDAATMHAIAAGVSTRRYAGTLDQLP